MGTTARVVLYAPTRPAADDGGAQAAFARIAELDARPQRLPGRQRARSASTRAAGGPPVPSSRDLFARPLARAGDGPAQRGGLRRDRAAPCPASGGGRAGSGELPDPAELVAARALVGHALSSSSSPPRAPSASTGPACASTWAASPRATRPTRRCASSSARPHPRPGGAGRRGGGRRSAPGARGWTVAIATAGPARRRRSCSATRPSPPRATPSSGSRSTASATRTSSIRAPARRSPAAGASPWWRPSGIEADALATAVSVLGPEAGLALVETRRRTRRPSTCEEGADGANGSSNRCEGRSGRARDERTQNTRRNMDDARS